MPAADQFTMSLTYKATWIGQGLLRLMRPRSRSLRSIILIGASICMGNSLIDLDQCCPSSGHSCPIVRLPVERPTPCDLELDLELELLTRMNALNYGYDAGNGNPPLDHPSISKSNVSLHNMDSIHDLGVNFGSNYPSFVWSVVYY